MTRRVPVAASALALALAGLGNLLAGYSPALRLACGALSALLLLLVMLRALTDTTGIRAELATPAGLSVAPAFFMACMLLATYLKPVAPLPALILWWTALVLQFAVIGLFARRFLVAFEPATVLPSWFLVFVGFVIASVTSPAFQMQALGRVLLYIGLLGYAVALALVTYRLARGAALPEPALPTVAIYAAPPALCLAGYLAVTDTKAQPVVYALLALSALSVLFVLARLPRILGLSFYPSIAALTFPFVITAIALKQSSAFLAASGGIAIPVAAVRSAEFAASAIVVYVLARYIAFLARPAQA